jgi:hypothetical protein
MTTAQITIEPTYTYEGTLRSDAESACTIECPCGATTESWTFANRAGRVCAECPSCDAVLVA